LPTIGVLGADTADLTGAQENSEPKQKKTVQNNNNVQKGPNKYRKGGPPMRQNFCVTP